MSEQTRTKFLCAMGKIEENMNSLGYVRCPAINQGFVTWVSFKRDDMEVEFVCGPSSFHIEMFIFINDVSGKEKYNLSDLMKIGPIKKWIKNNVLSVENEDTLIKEAEWFVKLLDIATPLLVKH